MIVLRKYIAIPGLVISFLSALTPFLKVPIKGNWNLFQVDVALFFITYFILGLTTLFFFVRKVAVYRLFTRIAALWYLISIAGVWFKINNYFGWGFADRLLGKTIHLRWGWVVYLIGIVLLLVSTRKVVGAK